MLKRISFPGFHQHHWLVLAPLYAVLKAVQSDSWWNESCCVSWREKENHIKSYFRGFFLQTGIKRHASFKTKPLNNSFHKSLLQNRLTFLLFVKFKCAMCCKRTTVRKERGTEAKMVYQVSMNHKQWIVVMVFVAFWPLLWAHHEHDEFRQNWL